MTADADPIIEAGWVSEVVRLEHPRLALHSVVVDGTLKRSAPDLRERLSHLSSRLTGAHAIALRSRPVPHAYRVFYRHIGLDPDDRDWRVAAEEAAVRRLLAGEYRSENNIYDSVLLAIVETGVPVWAVDDERLLGPLGIRETGVGERLGHGPDANGLPTGGLVVADDAGVVSVLFGELADDRRPSRATRRLRIFALQVDGVPVLHLEEALWECAEAIACS